MHINYSTQADEIQMKSVADCEEDIWCNITTTKTQHYRHSSTVFVNSLRGGQDLCLQVLMSTWLYSCSIWRCL